MEKFTLLVGALKNITDLNLQWFTHDQARKRWNRNRNLFNSFRETPLFCRITYLSKWTHLQKIRCCKCSWKNLWYLSMWRPRNTG